MNGKKAKALRRATARFISENKDKLNQFFPETYHTTLNTGQTILYRCPRRLYQVAKSKYKAGGV